MEPPKWKVQLVRNSSFTGFHYFWHFEVFFGLVCIWNTNLLCPEEKWATKRLMEGKCKMSMSQKKEVFAARDSCYRAVFAGRQLPLVHKKCASQAGRTSPRPAWASPGLPGQGGERSASFGTLCRSATLGALFRDVRKCNNEESKLEKSQGDSHKRGVKGCVASGPPTEDLETERGLSSLVHLLFLSLGCCGVSMR